MKDEQIKALIADEKVRAAFSEAIAICAKAVNAFAKEVGPILERLQLSPMEKAEPEKPKGIPINLNDTVKVKLTPFGLQHYRNFHFSIVGKWPSDPSTDAGGYSNFQLHDLANIYGELLTVGNPELPFETDMILVRDFTEALPEVPKEEKPASKNEGDWHVVRLENGFYDWVPKTEENQKAPVVEFGSMWECKRSEYLLIASSERDHPEGKISYIFSDGSGRHEMDKETFLRRFEPVKPQTQSRRFVFVCLVPDSIAEYYAYDFETGKCCQLKESCIRAQRTVGFMNRGLPKLSTFDWQVKDEVTKLATGQPS